MNSPLKAQVKNGRLVLDEPTDLPEGEVVYLVPVDESADDDDGLDEDERAELHRSIDQGLNELEAGKGIDGEVFLAELRARRRA